MKVILINDVKNLGKKNTIVSVADGYAKNYLLRNNLAVVANETNLLQLQQELNDIENEKQINTFHNNALKQKLEKQEYNFTLKLNNGKCFGSIQNHDILNLINKDEQLITKNMFDKNYKLTIGVHQVIINISKDTKAYININIKGID